MIDPIQLKSTAVSLPVASGKPIQHPVAERFAWMLDSEIRKSGGVRFSAHAQERLESRGIQLSSDEVAGINRAVEQAAAKGSRESLVLTERVALVVNIPNRTVITALPSNEAKNNIFTNIDSAVVASAISTPQSSTENTRPAPEWGGLRAADRLTRRNDKEI